MWFAIALLVVVIVYAVASSRKPQEPRTARSAPRPATPTRPPASTPEPEPEPGPGPDLHPYVDSEARSARARTYAAIYSRDYLPDEIEAEHFTLGDDGMPTGRLIAHRGQLVLTTDSGGLVNRSSGRIYRLGIYTFRIRGVSHHEAAVIAGDFRPGATLTLTREPDNPHDSNAIAVHALGAHQPAGYVNKLNAKRLTRKLGQGADLVAISLTGAGPGHESVAPWVLVTSPAILAHLQRTARP